MSSEDPLEDLYVDKDQLDKERLTNVLQSYVGIDQESGEPHFKKPYHNLSSKEKILVYLLYRKAARALGQLTEDEVGVTGKDIAEETGINYNTLRGQLSKIDLVKKEKKKGGYHIPTVNLVPAMEEVEEEDENE